MLFLKISCFITALGHIRGRGLCFFQTLKIGIEFSELYDDKNVAAIPEGIMFMGWSVNFLSHVTEAILSLFFSRKWNYYGFHIAQRVVSRKTSGSYSLSPRRSTQLVGNSQFTFLLTECLVYNSIFLPSSKTFYQLKSVLLSVRLLVVLCVICVFYL